MHAKTNKVWHCLDTFPRVTIWDWPSSVRETSPVMESMKNIWLEGILGVCSMSLNRSSAWAVLRSSRSSASTCMKGIPETQEVQSQNYYQRYRRHLSPPQTQSILAFGNYAENDITGATKIHKHLKHVFGFIYQLKHIGTQVERWYSYQTPDLHIKERDHPPQKYD